MFRKQMQKWSVCGPPMPKRSVLQNPGNVLTVNVSEASKNRLVFFFILTFQPQGGAMQPTQGFSGAYKRNTENPSKMEKYVDLDIFQIFGYTHEVVFNIQQSILYIPIIQKLFFIKGSEIKNITDFFAELDFLMLFIY